MKTFSINYDVLYIVENVLKNAIQRKQYLNTCNYTILTLMDTSQL